MPISKEPILYPLVSSTPNVPTGESFTFDWNWGLHKALSAVTGLVEFIPGIGILATPYTELLNYVYGDVIDDLFPKTDSNNRPTSDVTLLFQTFMAAAEQLMDKKIDKQVKSDALANLNSLHKDLQAFKQQLDNLENNKNPADEEQIKRVIQTQYQLVHTAFAAMMPKFSKEGEEVLLLSSYAQAANLHLIFLREVYQKGADWGFAAEIINGYYDAPNTRLG
ncbi:hypothetical protein ABE42_00140, partial [Bacillus thuringiensis]|nr:hypothetical protein [Bacillus thuringiensis]